MPNTHRLLICDDDASLRETLMEQLDLYDEFTVLTAVDGQSAIDRVTDDRIDLAVMDVGLPDMDGREAVRAMRRSGYRGPVIMLTAQDSEDDTVEGLEAGANDYVTKPFRFAVLLARIRAQTRRLPSGADDEQPVVSFGDVQVDLAAKTVVRRAGGGGGAGGGAGSAA